MFGSIVWTLNRDILPACTQTFAVPEHVNEAGKFLLERKLNIWDIVTVHWYKSRVSLENDDIDREIEIPEAWKPRIKEHNC